MILIYLPHIFLWLFHCRLDTYIDYTCSTFFLHITRYKQAAFCYEELILAQPTVPLYHLAYADVSSISFSQNYLFVETLLSFFCGVLRRKGNCRISQDNPAP